LIRGGWYDRNGVYFSDGVDGNGLKSVNIISKGKIDTKK
jgi:DNA gyrase/topoisomerase IV subunit B